MYFSAKYKGRTVKTFQKDITVIFQNIKKIRDILFGVNLILNTSCEFQYDDMKCDISYKRVDGAARNTILLFVFCDEMDLALMPFTMRFMQCIQTSVLRN